MSRGALIAIGLCFVVFIIVISFSDGSSYAETEPLAVSSTQADKQPLKYGDDVDKATLVTACEMAIKPQLKKPKSFDVDMGQSKVYDHEGKLVLDMFYYAENSYGASTMNEVFCDFSYRGTLLNIMHV